MENSPLSDRRDFRYNKYVDLNEYRSQSKGCQSDHVPTGLPKGTDRRPAGKSRGYDSPSEVDTLVTANFAVSAIFADGFESGNTAVWSAAAP
jgi:hypothetical protein